MMLFSIEECNWYFNFKNCDLRWILDAGYVKTWYFSFIYYIDVIYFAENLFIHLVNNLVFP